MFADNENEDRMFTRAKWRMHIAQDARTPGYEQWVHLMKSFLEYFPEPQAKPSSSPSVVEQWPSTQIVAERKQTSSLFELLTSV